MRTSTSQPSTTRQPSVGRGSRCTTIEVKIPIEDDQAKLWLPNEAELNNWTRRWDENVHGVFLEATTRHLLRAGAEARSVEIAEGLVLRKLVKAIELLEDAYGLELGAPEFRCTYEPGKGKVGVTGHPLAEGRGHDEGGLATIDDTPEPDTIHATDDPADVDHVVAVNIVGPVRAPPPVVPRVDGRVGVLDLEPNPAGVLEVRLPHGHVLGQLDVHAGVGVVGHVVVLPGGVVALVASKPMSALRPTAISLSRSVSLGVTPSSGSPGRLGDGEVYRLRSPSEPASPKKRPNEGDDKEERPRCRRCFLPLWELATVTDRTFVVLFVWGRTLAAVVLGDSKAPLFASIPMVSLVTPEHVFPWLLEVNRHGCLLARRDGIPIPAHAVDCTVDLHAEVVTDGALVVV